MQQFIGKHFRDLAKSIQLTIKNDLWQKNALRDRSKDRRKRRRFLQDFDLLLLSQVGSRGASDGQSASLVKSFIFLQKTCPISTQNFDQ